MGFITITSLEFGDASPKTPMGKFLTSICMLIGLLKLSLFTGSLLQVVTNTQSLSIKDRHIVVKNMTTEQFVVEKKYNAVAIVKKSYDQVIEHIANGANGDTFGAVIDINTARYMTDLSKNLFISFSFFI